MQLLQAGSPRSQPTFRAEYECQPTSAKDIMAQNTFVIGGSAPLHVQQPCGALVLPLLALIGLIIVVVHRPILLVG